jgi:DNA polymerase III alpha subunit
VIHLRLRTEYNFRRVYGSVARVVASVTGNACGIADTGAWGHVSFAKACKKAGKRPIFGVEVPVVTSPKMRVKNYGVSMALLARNAAGLEELYQVMTRANSEEYFYHFARLGYTDINELSENIIILTGNWPDLNQLKLRSNVYLEVNPASHGWLKRAVETHHQLAVTADNYFPRAQDRGSYELMVDKAQQRTSLMHLPDEYELRNVIPDLPDSAFTNTQVIADACTAKLPKAENVKYPDPIPLSEMCRQGAIARGLKITEWGGKIVVGRPENWSGGLPDWRFNDDTYEQRLVRELAMIKEKKFEDYFYVIADLVTQAKKDMLVGPARGSSAGSLVCYLLGITDVDPIVHDLMFERFIDITRADLPDIDIDFQDTKRDLVIKHLQKKYGAERVGRIGTVNRMKAKSCLGLVAKKVGIPPWEITDLKGAVIERSTGDARAQFCIADALDSLDIGKALVQKFPALRHAAALEAHARHSGMHAAGLVVTNEPISQYGVIDRSGAIQMDKKDAEVINLLKIDALGLRTLSVLQDCLDQIKKSREWLVTYPLDDIEAFAVFNEERYAGLFQFEGYALQSLTRQMKIREFYDIVSITALARPGPLHCGAATEFIERRVGKVAVSYLHPLAEPLTRDTYGTVIYQEQVMAIGRVIGQLSWEDVSQLRKAMSKSLGEEFFNQYWVKFEAGAAAHGIDSKEAKLIWEKICTFGSWAFNKSHAVSYGLVSYWCSVLKAHWPLEYAAACLRNSKDEEQTIKLLREIKLEGFDFLPVDPAHSLLTWSVKDGQLLGGLTNVKGIGVSKAREILAARKSKEPYKPGIRKLLVNPKTPFDDVFEGERRFGDVYRNPHKYNITSLPVTYVKDVQDNGDYVVVAKIKEKNLRDLNEYGNVVKRGGRRVEKNNLFLNLYIEDDTGGIIATVGRFEYQRYGKAIVEAGREGDWFIFAGEIKNNWRKLYVKKVRKLT